MHSAGWVLFPKPAWLLESSGHCLALLGLHYDASLMVAFLALLKEHSSEELSLPEWFECFPFSSCPWHLDLSRMIQTWPCVDYPLHHSLAQPLLWSRWADASRADWSTLASSSLYPDCFTCQMPQRQPFLPITAIVTNADSWPDPWSIQWTSGRLACAAPFDLVGLGSW